LAAAAGPPGSSSAASTPSQLSPSELGAARPLRADGESLALAWPWLPA
jgi:hypothetical protein